MSPKTDSSVRISDEVEKSRTQWLEMPSGDCFSFAEDDGTTALAFDPCAPDLRLIIHEEAQERGLTSSSEGEGEDRHVAVYKASHFPDAAAEAAQAAALDATAALEFKRKKKRGANFERPPKPSALSAPG